MNLFKSSITKIIFKLIKSKNENLFKKGKTNIEFPIKSIKNKKWKTKINKKKE